MIHPIDAHVGKRLKKRRTALDLSQGALAKMVGVTFQQIQKYETGANRVSASKLYEFANALTVSVGFFYDEIHLQLPEGMAEEQRAYLAAQELMQEEMKQLTSAYRSITDQHIRNQLLKFVKALANTC